MITAKTCDPTGFGEGQTHLGAVTVTTNENGDIGFIETLPVAVGQNRFVTATATDPNGNTSEFSQCVRTDHDNTTWWTALDLNLFDGSNQTDDGLAFLTGVDQYLDKLGQSRWYRFRVQPNTTLVLMVTGDGEIELPGNYNLSAHQDILALFEELQNANNPNTDNTEEDLLNLGAQFNTANFSTLHIYL